MAALRVALVQMAIADGEPQRNLDRALCLIATQPADLYILPELWTSGYAHARWAAIADQETPVIGRELEHLAHERRAWIAGTMISRDAAGRLVNRLWLYSPNGGMPVTYDKAHLFAPMQEDRRLEPGAARVRAPVGGWTAALSICFDLRFPEMYRLDALAGAQLFIVPAEWPADRAEILETLARARAIENQCYLALCNRVGCAADGTRFAGGSALLGPDGSVLAAAGEREGVVVGTARRAQLTTTRGEGPHLTLRRPGIDW